METLPALNHIGNGEGFAGIFPSQEPIGFGVVGNGFGGVVELEPGAAEPVGNVGQVDHCRAAVSFLDIGIWFLPRADAIEEVDLVRFVGEAAVLFRDNLLRPIRRPRKHLPAAAVATEEHQAFGAVEFNASRVLVPERE